MEDKYNLERFISRQKDTYDTAYKELSQGMKQSHWMWWIFPQIIGLGMTSISKEYSVKSIEELMDQDAGAEKVEIENTGLKNFDKIARK